MAPPRLDPEEALPGPLYLVAALLVIMPAIDFVMSVGAPQPGNVQWRFATVGLLSSYTLTPILGFALATGVAAVAKHATLQRFLVAAGLFTSVVLTVLIVGFVLDVLQLGVSIPAEGQRAFRSASLRAGLKHLLSAVAFGYLGWRARRMIPERVKEKQPQTVRIVTK